jgi:hypothetical protein
VTSAFVLRRHLSEDIKRGGAENERPGVAQFASRSAAWRARIWFAGSVSAGWPLLFFSIAEAVKLSNN